MREKVKKLFYFATFVNALREGRYSVLWNLTTESLKENHSLIKSSVSHLKHVTAKSNSK